MNRAGAVSRVESIVESKLFHRGVIVLIFLNAVIVGLGPIRTYTPTTASCSAWRIARFSICLPWNWRYAFFAAGGLREFFKSGWNIFDLVIVAISFLPASQFFTVARLFRILRVLRAVSALPDLQRLVAALLRSLPSLGHISLLLVLLIYVYGAIGTSFFATASPQYFGLLPRSVLTLFGVITLEGWVESWKKFCPRCLGPGSILSLSSLPEHLSHSISSLGSLSTIFNPSPPRKTMIWSRSASISRDWKSVSIAYRKATWPVEGSISLVS